MAKSKCSWTEWTLLKFDFTETRYGVKLVYDEIDTALADI